MVRAARSTTCATYCEGDCLNLFGLYVRWAFVSGKSIRRATMHRFGAWSRSLEHERDVRSHLGTFLDRWRATCRPTPMFVPGGERAARTIARAD